MPISLLAGLIMTLIYGWIWKSAANTSTKYGFTKKTFTVCCLLAVFIEAPLVAYIGYNQAKANLVQYRENWTGWETGATLDVTTCHRDGSCEHEYDCDPYTVKVTKKRSDGSTYEDEETRYHECPYTTEEWRIAVQSTVGEVVLATANLPTNPDQHRWRATTPVPDHLPSGIPQEWTEAKARVDSRDPGPVTRRMVYKNFILGSQGTLLKNFAASINDYHAKGVLPSFRYELEHYYQLNRAYFVGFSPKDSADWNLAINRFNAALGNELQGDLHLVIVKSEKVTEPDDYTNAVLAYWQSYKFSRDAFSKNGILIVLGTEDGKTVSWSRATTGMPVGNETLVDAIRWGLVGAQIDARTLLGDVRPALDKGYATTRTGGRIESLLWDKTSGFKRVCMECKDGKGVGFGYLFMQLQPTTGQLVLIAFLIMLGSTPI